MKRKSITIIGAECALIIKAIKNKSERIIDLRNFGQSIVIDTDTTRYFLSSVAFATMCRAIYFREGSLFIDVTTPDFLEYASNQTESLLLELRAMKVEKELINIFKK